MTTPMAASGEAKLGVGEKEIVPTAREIAVFKKLIGDPLFNVSDTKFPSWMVDTVARYGLPIPIGNIVGFSQFTAQVATTVQPTTAETTSSDTYTDLSTAGPSLTGLPDGQYLVLFGNNSWSTSGQYAYMNVQQNATALSDDATSLKCPQQVETPGAFAFTCTLNGGGNNSLTAKYRIGSAADTAHFKNRWLIALKFANA